MLHSRLRADTSKDRRQVGYCANIALLVALLHSHNSLPPWQLLGEDHLKALRDANLAQLLAQNIGKRAVVGFGEVCKSHRSCIKLCARTHRRDVRNAALHAISDKRNLWRKRIYGIHQKIHLMLPKQLLDAALLQIAVNKSKAHIGINILKPLCQYGALGLPDGRVKRYKLAVLVALTNNIGIQKNQVAHACPAEHLRRIGSNSAQANHCHRTL